jgi:hypothetical protein
MAESVLHLSRPKLAIVRVSNNEHLLIKIKYLYFALPIMHCYTPKNSSADFSKKLKCSSGRGLQDFQDASFLKF